VWLTDITEHPTAWIPAVVATLERSDRRCPDRGTPQRLGIPLLGGHLV
jgi:hypothetical protein